MALPIRIKLPDNLLGEYGEYARITEKYDRTTTGQAQYTNPDTLVLTDTTGSTYDNQGENGLGLLLFNEAPSSLKTYIFSDDVYNDIGTAIETNEIDITTNTDDISDINAEGTTIDITVSGDILLTYAKRFLNCTNAGAITLTIQPNASIALPLYTEIAIKLKGAGTVTFVEGAGVTIDSIDDLLTLATQYATVALHQTALNVWTLSGLLE